jgi:5-methylcytosine-specific restriction endonuclease McrA
MTEYKKAWQKANPERYSANMKAYYLRLNLINKNISQRTLKAWSIQVRARDTACLYCGSTDKLHAHHILSKVKHPEHALFLNNGITLCEVCHIQEHILNGDL